MARRFRMRSPGRIGSQRVMAAQISSIRHMAVPSGGTSGQVLKKTGSGPHDHDWQEDFSELHEYNGNIGIGVDQPDHELTIEGEGSTITQEMRAYSNGHNHCPRMQAIRGRGTAAQQLSVNDADRVLLWTVRSVSTGAQEVLVSRVTWQVDGTPGNNTIPVRATWETTDINGQLTSKLEVGPDDIYLRESLRVGGAKHAVSATPAREIIIGVTDTTAARTITISSEEIAKSWRVWFVKDESGGAATNNITVATEGSETIDGAATAVINSNYGALRLYSDGSNLFLI